jgi:hypothetical protein
LAHAFRSEHPVAIVLVNLIEPKIGIRYVFLGRMSEQAVYSRTQVTPSPRFAEFPLVDDDRCLLDQGPVLRLGGP